MPTWAAATVLAFAGAVAWAPPRLSRNLRLAAGGLLGALATAHVAVWWGRIADPVAWITDAVLIALALGLLVSASQWQEAGRPASLQIGSRLRDDRT